MNFITDTIAEIKAMKPRSVSRNKEETPDLKFDSPILVCVLIDCVVLL